MGGEPREKQFTPLTQGKMTKNSEFMRPSQCSGGDGVSSYKTSSPPSPQEVDPFSHHMPPFTIYEKVKFALGTVLFVPSRAILLILVLAGAWLVAKIGMLGLENSEIESYTISRKGWRRQLMHWYRYFGYGFFMRRVSGSA